MYAPIGQTGKGGTGRGPGSAQVRNPLTQSSGIASAIRSADLSLQNKKKEAQRQYENAQTMMRTDLNAIAAFDVTKAGPDKAKALTEMARDMSMKIREMNDPVEARALIAKFTQYYNSGVAREQVKEDASKDAKGMVGASGEELSKLNSGLPAGMEYDEVDASWMANADAKWSKEYVYQDGEIFVRDPEGSLIPESEADFLQDASMYQVGTHSVDVGSLIDWAQSDATKTAIGFKNGKWDETRARGYYRDNVLLDEREGKKHRLQLLTTMEDRGLTAHLTEEEKKMFRDGQNLESEKFSEIIQKGEDEFTERSMFDGVIGSGSGKGTSGKGGTNAEDDNITVNGLNVPSQDTGTLLKDLDYQARAGHNINRFNKMPSLQGAFEVPGKPNTDKLDIIGAGINSKGQRVAYIRGYEDVVTDTGIPGFEDTDRKKFYKEIVIGGDELGVGSDVYQEIYQNHPKMAELIENQLLDYEEGKLKKSPVQQGPGSGVDGTIRGARRVRMDAEGNVIEDIPAEGSSSAPPTSGDRTERNEARLAAREAAVDEYAQLQKDFDALNEQINRNPQTAQGAVAKQRALKERMNEISGGQFGEYIANIFPEQSNRATPDELAPFEGAAERGSDEAGFGGSATSDFFFDNPIGRLLGYKGSEQRAKDEERRQEREARREEVLSRQKPAEDAPVSSNRQLAETAGEVIFEEEGYSAGGTLINVPKSSNSGVTIGGLDLGSAAGDIDKKLEILSSYLPPEQVAALNEVTNLTGTDASNALANAIEAGRINPDIWGLTDNDFKEMQVRYLDDRVIPSIIEKTSKFSPDIDREDIESLPAPVIKAIASMEFVTPGLGRQSSALTAVGKAIESGDPADWLKAADTYDMYYGTLQQQEDSLSSGKILAGNIKRAQKAAALIRSVYS